MLSMTEAPSSSRKGLLMYQGRNVQVYLLNGGVLRGKVETIDGYWITVFGENINGRQQKASANLDHVISIRLVHN